MHLAGKNGKLMVGADPGVTDVLGLTSWSADLDADALETTDFQAAGVRTYVAGNQGGAGSFEGNWETALVPTEVPPDLNEGQTVEMNCYINATEYITFTAIITGLSITCPQPGVVTFSGTFTINGAVDKSNLYTAP